MLVRVRAPLFLTILTCLVGASPSCSSVGPPQPSDHLSVVFPAVAPRILEAPRTFAVGESGWLEAPGDPGGLRLQLPARGEDTIRVELGDDLRVSVREVGAE